MKKRIFLIIYILIVFLSAGCWNKREPKDLAIINSIIYDKVDNGLYQVTVEFLNLNGSGDKGSSKSQGKNFKIETFQGITLREALANVSSSIEKTIYAGHIHARFFTETAVQDNMAATLDYLLRDHLTDETPLMVVIKGTQPEKTYEASIGLSDSVGVYIDSLSVSQQKTTSKSVFITTLDFTKDFLNDGKEPIAGVIEIIPANSESLGTEESLGSSDKNKIIYEGLAAFKEDKLVGYFNGVETRAYNFIIGKIGSAIISVPIQNGYAICEVTNASSDIKTTIDESHAIIDISIKSKIRIIADGTDLNASDLDFMKEIQRSFNQQLLPEIASAVEKAQSEFKSDIFGFGAYAHAQNPNQWKDIKEDWNNIFSKATVNISVESSVYQTGETKDSVLSEFTEE